MRTKRIDVSRFTAEQIAALADLGEKCRAANGYRDEFNAVARDVFSAYVNSPEWQVRQAPHDGDQPPPQPTGWNIGPPRIAYVNPEDIKPIGRQHDTAS